MTQIYYMIYTVATKLRVIKPSQWKDNMYISLNWRDDDDQNDSDPLDVCPFCGRPMKPGNPWGMCNSCYLERQGYGEDGED